MISNGLGSIYLFMTRPGRNSATEYCYPVSAARNYLAWMDKVWIEQERLQQAVQRRQP